MANSSTLQALKTCELTDYDRVSVQEGRWASTWSAFKSNFGKVVMINLLTLLFFMPLAAAAYLREVYVGSLVTVYPFASNIGPAALPSNPGALGMFEQLSMQADIIFYSVVVLCSLIASVGVAGACYSLRRLVNTQGNFTIKGYFHGVRKCYFRVAVPVAVFMLVFFCTVLVSAWKDLTIARGGAAGWPIAATVLMIILCVLVGIVCMWFISVGVSYKAGPALLFKGGFTFLFGSVIQTLFMLAFCFIPVWLLLIGGFFRVLGIIFLIFCGFSFVFISWMSFSQWVFDMFIAPEPEEQKKHVKTEREIAAERAEEVRNALGEIIAAGRSELVATPVPPIVASSAPSLGATFTRKDVAAAAHARKKLEEDMAAYTAKHKNDKRYSDYEKLFADRDKPLDDGKKGRKKKKISADNLLR